MTSKLITDVISAASSGRSKVVGQVQMVLWSLLQKETRLHSTVGQFIIVTLNSIHHCVLYKLDTKVFGGRLLNETNPFNSWSHICHHSSMPKTSTFLMQYTICSAICCSLVVVTLCPPNFSFQMISSVKEMSFFGSALDTGLPGHTQVKPSSVTTSSSCGPVCFHK